MQNTPPTPSAPVDTGIKPADLATFRTTPDGCLKVNIERFGCLTIGLPNSEDTIEIYVTRSNEGERAFQTYVAAEVRRDGKTRRTTHSLTVTGEMVTVPNAPATKKERQQSTGHAAAAADAAASPNPANPEEPTTHEPKEPSANEIINPTEPADEHATAAEPALA